MFSQIELYPHRVILWGTKRKNMVLAVIVVAVVVFFVAAPVVYTPTPVYGPLHLNTYPTYPNWESLSCKVFGLGIYYGRTVSWVAVPAGSGESAGAMTAQYGNATQFGCPPSAAYLP